MLSFDFWLNIFLKIFPINILARWVKGIFNQFARLWRKWRQQEILEERNRRVKELEIKLAECEKKYLELEKKYYELTHKYLPRQSNGDYNVLEH